MLEAMSCGTPVLGFNVGGMSDIIQPNFNGDLALEISSAALSATLDLFVGNITRYDRLKIRQNIIDNYSLVDQAESYLNLYQAVLTT
jgi:glycosyltransferase involved in cell wall biosynthesis